MLSMGWLTAVSRVEPIGAGAIEDSLRPAAN
jgi:hypothetical protein